MTGYEERNTGARGESQWPERFKQQNNSKQKPNVHDPLMM